MHKLSSEPCMIMTIMNIFKSTFSLLVAYEKNVSVGSNEY